MRHKFKARIVLDISPWLKDLNNLPILLLLLPNKNKALPLTAYHQSQTPTSFVQPEVEARSTK